MKSKSLNLSQSEQKVSENVLVSATMFPGFSRALAFLPRLQMTFLGSVQSTLSHEPSRLIMTHLSLGIESSFVKLAGLSSVHVSVLSRPRPVCKIETLL